MFYIYIKCFSLDPILYFLRCTNFFFESANYTLRTNDKSFLKLVEALEHIGGRGRGREEKRKMEKTFNCQPPLNITTAQIENRATFVPVIFNNSLVFHPPPPPPLPPLPPLPSTLSTGRIHSSISIKSKVRRTTRRASTWLLRSPRN